MNGKAFIWDLDGTLLDSYGVIVSSLRQTLEELGVPMEEAEIRRRATAGSVSDVVNCASAATGRTFQEIKGRYSEISGGRYLEIAAMSHAREALEETAALGAVHFVYTHRGSTTAPVLENLGLDRFFKEVVSSLNGFPRKPAPDALLYLLEKHRLERDRVYYVGDRTLDVDCAKNAGVRSVLYSPSGAGTADYVVRDLLDVRAIATE
ncbi:HAD-IA family hydrolase [Oscillibacter sp.]|uniref:HAD-IA family hydrolase n=1 Tax=Oscillibacter sp. TaxID=1945593 RepID=UPI002D80AC45|nr:HAD-IA family hydrolase [Oscillibacter sp.]